MRADRPLFLMDAAMHNYSHHYEDKVVVNMAGARQ